jgi:hypothetical protein
MEKLQIRLGNIEARKWQKTYEIIKWQPNSYYGKKDQMIADGWEYAERPDGSWSLRKQNRSVDGSCFANPESCFVIAWLKWDTDERSVDLESVGSRLLDLSAEERNAFWQVYEAANKFIPVIELENTEENEY